MKYSLVNGERREAEKGLLGACIGCEQPMISKCGTIKINHWAHRSKCECDHWWENETEWHRAWKGHFPIDCQEVVHKADDGEIHIADVKTPKGWVIEFQHSAIKPEERLARSEFYEKLVWVVDGTRRLRDKAQFLEALEHGREIYHQPHIRTAFIGFCRIIEEWSGLRVPVIFDFGEENMWCLLPIKDDSWVYVTELSRTTFVGLHRSESPNDDFFIHLKRARDFAVFLETQRRTRNELDALKQMPRYRNPLAIPRARRGFRF